ncbi:hypothetical protein MTR67_005004 [Solanum verrucosum]|uniref:Uncharacterized protein n=1 Tax=Solanum verrucosum TaxID=315347 RepID=A0AAF0TB14_SOLVR|nr:hypothetical protein MTR67_005004 [Solanum verrucosum]
MTNGKNTGPNVYWEAQLIAKLGILELFWGSHSSIFVISLVSIDNVKLVSCGNVSLESSYEKVGRCVYTSTLLFECGKLGLKPADVKESCFGWRLAYSERLSTDFYITDKNSGIRAFVKAGPDSRVIPLIKESRLVTTAKNCKVLASHLRKWLRDRNLSSEARLLRLEEGYIKEGSSISVFGILQRSNDVMVVTPPQELISTGCLWKKLLLPVDVDGLILAIP